MDTWGAILFFAVLYVAYQLGRLKGRWEVLSGKFTARKKSPAGENIEKADYEEIK
jgi:hypothetical protein